MITAEEFREGFNLYTNWGEAEKMVKRLDSETAKKLYDAMKMTSDYVGLDMRSEFYLGLIKAIHLRPQLD